MLPAPAFLGAPDVPTMGVDDYYNDSLPPPGQGNAAAKRRHHAGVHSPSHGSGGGSGGDSIASELTGRTFETGGGSLGKGGGQAAQAHVTVVAPGQRQALAFAMRGLDDGNGAEAETGTESWKKAKPRQPGAEPTVIERMLLKKERRAVAATMAEAELQRRTEARKQAVADGRDDPGSPFPLPAYGQKSSHSSSSAAAAAAAASLPAEKTKGGGMRGGLIDFISRPGAFGTDAAPKPPRPQPPKGPRQAAVGSSSVGGRVTLPTGRPSYELTTSSAFYDRAFAVATERRGPDPEEAARLEAEAEAKLKAEAKKRQLTSARKGVNAFLMRGFMSPEEQQRLINEEVSARERIHTTCIPL
jgi:hypothetical protein